MSAGTHLRFFIYIYIYVSDKHSSRKEKRRIEEFVVPSSRSTIEFIVSCVPIEATTMVQLKSFINMNCLSNAMLTHSYVVGIWLNIQLGL